MLTAAVALPLLAAATYIGGLLLLILTMGVAIVGAMELTAMGRERGVRAVLPVTLIAAAAYVFAGFAPSVDLLRVLVTVAVVGPLIIVLARGRELREAVLDWAWTVATPLYVGWPLSYFLLLRGTEQDAAHVLPTGFIWVAITLAVTFSTDSAAYFAGRTFGRRRLAPRISPSKTWEGTVAGLVAASAIGGLAAPLVDLAVWEGMVFGLGIGIAAILGDLSESLLKRGFGVKDSGVVVPGHGGLLDRLDSLLFAGIAAYYLRALFI